jgi:hypothetical protein
MCGQALNITAAAGTMGVTLVLSGVRMVSNSHIPALDSLHEGELQYLSSTLFLQVRRDPKLGKELSGALVATLVSPGTQQLEFGCPPSTHGAATVPSATENIACFSCRGPPGAPDAGAASSVCGKHGGCAKVNNGRSRTAVDQS